MSLRAVPASCPALQKQRQLLEWQAARSAGDEAGTLAAAASLERQDSAGSGNEPMEVRRAGAWEAMLCLENAASEVEPFLARERERRFNA